jgi:hypothetical protein
MQFSGRPALILAILLAAAVPAASEPVQNPVAVFSGLDKVGGKITTLEVKVGEAIKFGSLVVRARICNSRPVTEEPNTTSFVEIDDVKVDGTVKRVFTGWMFAESPALNALEHPVYDIWLTGCQDPAAPAPKMEKSPESSAAPIDPETMPKDND